MNDTTKVILAIIGAIAIFSIASYMGENTANKVIPKSQTTQQAVSNTQKNAFIQGCVNEGASRSECVCMERAMSNMYADFYTNESRLNRIVTTGYNQSEVAVLSSCVMQ